MNRILVVDDEPAVVAGIQLLLSTYDIESESAVDCDSATDLLESSFFPIVLADLRLRSEEEGLRLIDAVRRISPRSRIASMTGYFDAATDARLRERGAQLVLRKPFLGEELIESLREMLDVVSLEAAQSEDLDATYRATIGKLEAISRGRYHFPADDAEELIQEAWVLYLEKSKGVRSPHAWLNGTIANLCKQEIDRRQRSRQRDAELPERTVLPREDTRLSIQQALGRLDDRSRTLCTLIGMEDLTYEEVAARLAIPIGSVGPFYQRARQRLRHALEG